MGGALRNIIMRVIQSVYTGEMTFRPNFSKSGSVVGGSDCWCDPPAVQNPTPNGGSGTGGGQCTGRSCTCQGSELDRA